jgi:DNA-binding response OmpR family regulator
VEEVATEIMHTYKVVELFQTMAIVSLNMGNLTLEVNNLKNRLAIGEKEKALLYEELDKKTNFHKGFKHIVEIWRKNKAEVKQNVKVFIKKLRMKMRSSRVTYHG